MRRRSSSPVAAGERRPSLERLLPPRAGQTGEAGPDDETSPPGDESQFWWTSQRRRFAVAGSVAFGVVWLVAVAIIYSSSSLDPMCSGEAKRLSSAWRSIEQRGDPPHHCDRTGSTDGGDDPDSFGGRGSAARIVRFDLPGGENSLAMRRPHRVPTGPHKSADAYAHCGTDAGGWLSAWPGPHVTGNWFKKDGGPARFYDAGGFVLPARGSAAAEATVCFDDGVGACDFHMKVKVANCGDHLRYELPPVPYCSSGAGLAYCADHAPDGILQ
jgi:hypothetical protein